MNNRFTYLAFVSSAVCLGAIAMADGEQKVTIDTAPSAVKLAVAKVIGSNKLDSLTKETEDGKTTYEAEFDVDGVDHSATISETGAVIEEEVEIKVTDLPAAVSEALAKAEPKGVVKEVSKLTADGKSCFEADVTVGETKHEIKVSTEGSVLSNKVEKDEHDKD